MRRRTSPRFLLLADAARSAVQAREREVLARPITVAQLAALSADQFRRKGGHPQCWPSDPAWLAAFDQVLILCRAEGWQPRCYITSALGFLGPWVVAAEKRLQPGHLICEKTLMRVRSAIAKRAGEWALDLEGAVWRGAEIRFATTYFADRRCTLRQAEAEARLGCASWSLARTEARPDVRLPALLEGVTAVSMELRERFPAPAPRWRWIDQRALARRLTTSGAPVYAAKPRQEDDWDWDPSLGVLA